ncbi:MFS transporter [Streptacidiphilus cavernicola]|uniref:MFS transporter n=1 Tax=Streptacidiphilus cavernicola TaxID=3342716 RepID=A0ABV6W5Y5_9ACTN
MTSYADNFRVLSVPAFRRFFLGQCASLLGDFLAGPALAFAVLGLSGSASQLGLVLAARLVPTVLFMLLGGAIADRLPRQRVMRWADLARAAGQGTTAVLILTGRADLAELMALQLVLGTGSALFTPAITGLVQQCVPAERRQAANALRGLAQSAAMVLGPLCSVALVLTVGPGWAIAADAGTYLFSAACLRRLGADPAAGAAAPVQARRLRRDLAQGWHEFSGRTWVWTTIAVASLANMAYATLSVLGPELSVRSYGGAAAWGGFLAAFGLGAVAGGAVGLHLRPRHPLRFALVAVSLFAAPALVLSGTTTPLPALAAFFLGGAGMMVFNPLWETTLQAHVPADRLSRVSSYEWAGSFAAQPLGLALAGPLALHLGLRHLLLAAGLLQLAATLSPLLLREIRNLPPEPPAAAPLPAEPSAPERPAAEPLPAAPLPPEPPAAEQLLTAEQPLTAVTA